jgi:hypothetical protein
MHQRTRHARRRSIETLFSAVLVILVLSACGNGNGEEDEATEVVATIEDDAGVVVASPDVAIGTPVGVPVDTPATVEGGDGVLAATPDGDVDGSPTPAIVVSAPPVVMPTEDPGADADTIVAATPDVAVAAAEREGVTGDGTSGPPLQAEDGEIAEPATPSEFVVESCEADEYPPFTGADASRVTAIEVNFRVGPGTDCEAIGEPLASGTTVEILSDAVVRDGEPEFSWVAVSVEGTEGWLVTDFLEAVD